jgi:hypothetical protein
MVGESFSTDLASIQPSTAKIQTFWDYLVDTYIDDDSDFPPEIWATCSSSMYLTTNVCKSFHSKLNSLFYTSHQSIHQFLEILKQCQTNTKIKTQSIVCTLRETIKQINKKIFIQTQITKLKNLEISNFDFVKMMSFKNLPLTL